jgi:hypothetical protein
MLLGLAGFVVAGCASGPERVPDEQLIPGDVDADPAMEILPTPDVRLESLSERMRAGWELADESFSIPMPPAPPSDNDLDFQRWSDEELRRWIAQKSRTVDSARRELDAAADENLRQRVMAGAIVGLMYEDVAMSLRSIPTPPALDHEPDIARIFREVMEGHAAPFLAHSHAAYRACARNADGGPDSLRHWRGFCAGRRVALPELP